MAKVLGLKQLLEKKFNYLPDLPEKLKASFGNLVDSFIMIIWGMSGNGKSSLIVDVCVSLMAYGKVLYVSLEEGTEASMQQLIMRRLNVDDHGGKIEFADHEMNYNELVKKLAKKKSPKFVVIDSVQYWNITYEQYKAMKEKFKKKAFIIISHASGKLPDGKVADKIRYDAGIKVHVDRYIAFVTCRYGGNQPYIIWEEGAKAKWGKEYKQAVTGIKEAKPPKAPRAKPEPPPEKVTQMQLLPPDKPVFKTDLKDII